MCYSLLHGLTITELLLYSHLSPQLSPMKGMYSASQRAHHIVCALHK